MNEHLRLLKANQDWVREKVALNPKYFEATAYEQKPEFLWIGCSDSRVPAEEITGTQPGELFVHRNVANIVGHTDFNLLSVLQFAILHLKVKHVIICGHYGCGGVKAALMRQRLDVLSEWLTPIKEAAVDHRGSLEHLPPPERFRRLVEVNVLSQVQNLARSAIVQQAWNQGAELHLHGWVYDLVTGNLKELIQTSNDADIDEAFRIDFAQK